MQVFTFPLRSLYRIYMSLVFFLSLVMAFPVFRYLLSDSQRFPKAFRVMRFYGKLVLLLGGIRLSVTGQEKIPREGPYIICSNHSSFIDIPCIYSLFPDYFVFTGKKEIEKWPLFHIFYTSGMNILVDRYNPAGSVKAYKRMFREIDRGHSLVIFPEGTVSRQAPRLADFKSGAFTLAIKKQVPILPVTFVNNWERIQRKGFTGKAGPGTAIMVIHDPVLSVGLKKEDCSRLMESVRDTIRQPLREKYGSKA